MVQNQPQNNLIKKMANSTYGVNYPSAIEQGLAGAGRDILGGAERVVSGAVAPRVHMSGLPGGQVTQNVRDAKPTLRQAGQNVSNFLKAPNPMRNWFDKALSNKYQK